MKAYYASEQVPYGLYFAPRGFDIRFVGAEGETLEGKENLRYVRFPNLVALGLLPLIGATFYFAFPVIVIGVVAFTAVKLGAKACTAVFDGKAHLMVMRWNPSTAYLKQPRKNSLDSTKDKEDEIK
ncbi:MAG: hypothetical protein A2428_13665 [Bdellovibrionales bacterium RIFOXYC1_FULL_54_43]|nr:MAG: hypothetical protein A2428_13665 [Bdellovibrionales bacterium RIFOXYC1_FULL_54_43]OFZ80854.1 MAG: hypothetical protein A2603_17085 [Bdellovibrionales bacterium RIFOXYD1_FULL_55_31]